MMKLSKVILASIIAFIPLKAFAQDFLNQVPQWAKNRGKPSYVKIDSTSYFTFAVDRQYVLLNNGNYGVILYSMSNSPDPMFSRAYYEFNCKTGQYSFQGEIFGQLINNEVSSVDWIAPCNTPVCKEYALLDSEKISGIKKHCPR